MKRSLYRKARPGELTTRALIDALVAAHPHEAKPGGCCDCGLAHWVRLEVGDPEHVIVRIRADAERTAKNRERP